MSLQKPRNPRLIWKDVINTFTKSETFTVAARLKVSAALCVEGVNNIIIHLFLDEYLLSFSRVASTSSWGKYQPVAAKCSTLLNTDS